MNRNRPLNAFPLIRTCRIDELEASLARIYTRPIMEIIGRDRMLKGIQNHCQLQHIALSYGSYEIEARWQFPGSNSLAHVFPVRGNAECVVGGKSIPIDSDHSVVISANESFSFANDADYERLTLIINPSALAMKLAAILGEPAHAPLKMNPAQDFKEHSARALRDNFMFLAGQLNSSASLPPLVLAEFEQTLMVMFLHANQHNYSHLLQQEPSDVGLGQVRRAQEYIDANWSKPLSFEAVSAATNVGVRQLFRKFKKSVGCSLIEFLRQTRLRHAQRMVQHPESSTTVRGIAFACGYSDANRFCSDYISAFGEDPSETLSRSKGAKLTRH